MHRVERVGESHSWKFLIIAVEVISAEAISSDTSTNDIVSMITPFNSTSDDVRDMREGKRNSRATSIDLYNEI